MTTKTKRLVSALFLAITAPTESKSAECVELAEWLAVGMTPAQIETCKRRAAKSAHLACDHFVTQKSKLN